MKLGNISQTIVPVPNFFMNTKSRTVDTFNIYSKTDSNIINRNNCIKKPISLKKNIKTQLEKNESTSNSTKSIPFISYKRENTVFRTGDVLTTFYDLNINNNPRLFTRECIDLNKEKYIPIYYRNNHPNTTQIKEIYFPEIVEVNKILNNTNRIPIKNKSRKKILSLTTLQNYYNYKKYMRDENIEGILAGNALYVFIAIVIGILVR